MWLFYFLFQVFDFFFCAFSNVVCLLDRFLESQDPEGKDKKGIPGFWAQCIGNHPSIAHLVTEEDGALLASLIDVKVSFSESMDSFTLTFVFEPNDFITNQEVTKTYTISPNILDDFPQLVNVECSPIEWKEGKNLTVTEVKKKQKAKSGKNKGQIRTVTSSVPKPSFFHFFSKPLGLEGEEDQEHDEEENEANVKLHAEDDMEVAQIFRLHLIANALGWFTGEALDDLQGFGGDEEEDDDDEEGEEGDEGDEDEEDEEDESDSDGEADKKKKKGGKGKKASGAAPTGGPAGQQPECKQN